ncbi:MAG: DNA-directed RNA polymerase subunit beta, partial [Desulfobacteraceae bacterium]|nr:DNA-directed RNA polymerase subunit beta [Desulfobacteraceae bacterium]
RDRIAELVIGQRCEVPLKKGKKTLIAKGKAITAGMLEDIALARYEGIVLQNAERTEKVHRVLDRYREESERCRAHFEDQVNRYESGVDLPPGVIKMVKVYVAMKRNLSVGDKMAGRHGNKGVVSRILPQEDLPYFADGTCVDMVLNPLGVPSRMNVGQVLEIHLGRAARSLGNQINRMLEENNLKELRSKFRKIFTDGDSDANIKKMDDEGLRRFAGFYRDGVHMATPVFDGAKESEIKELLEEAGVEMTGQTTLYDGRTGEPFKEKITVGTMYVLKLHHLVDDKIHARSIGPYSLVTQQPLGGKAQFGGQRLGEMEVWAMEAYGAAHALQEFLTVKSDDMAGRTRMYEKIVKGQNTLEPGLPESFKVLTKELQALGLDISLIEEEPQK